MLVVAWLLEGVQNARISRYEAIHVADCIAQVLERKRNGGRHRLELLGLDDDSIAARLEDVYRNLLAKNY